MWFFTDATGRFNVLGDGEPHNYHGGTTTQA